MTPVGRPRESYPDVMRIERVDERDSTWEDHHPRFRVYFFRGGERPDRSWSVDTVDVTDAEVLEVVRWAQDEIGDKGIYAVALVGEDPSSRGTRRRGLTWLVGMDANDVPADDHERALLESMTARRGKVVVTTGT